MHRPGIEPGPPTWQASILPLNHRCLSLRIISQIWLLNSATIASPILNIHNETTSNLIVLFTVSTFAPTGCKYWPCKLKNRYATFGDVTLGYVIDQIPITKVQLACMMALWRMLNALYVVCISLIYVVCISDLYRLSGLYRMRLRGIYIVQHTSPSKWRKYHILERKIMCLYVSLVGSHQQHLLKTNALFKKNKATLKATLRYVKFDPLTGHLFHFLEINFRSTVLLHCIANRFNSKYISFSKFSLVFSKVAHFHHLTCILSVPLLRFESSDDFEKSQAEDMNGAVCTTAETTAGQKEKDK